MTVKIDARARIADFWEGKGKFWAEIARRALDEARALPAVEAVRIAVVVLVLPDGRRRLDLAWFDYEAGDEAGAVALAESAAREEAGALAPGETLKVEIRDVLLASTRVVGLREAYDRLAAWATRHAEGGQDHVGDARKSNQTLLFCQNVLVLPDGERRIVAEQLEAGDGEGLCLTAHLHGQLRRQRGHLRSGERLEVAFREGSLDATELVREGPVVAPIAAKPPRKGGARHRSIDGAASQTAAAQQPPREGKREVPR